MSMQDPDGDQHRRDEEPAPAEQVTDGQAGVVAGGAEGVA